MPRAVYVSPDLPQRRGMLGRLAARLRRLYTGLASAMVRQGLPAWVIGYRFRKPVLPERAASQVTIVHPPGVHRVDCAGGFAGSRDLPADPGWWGFSFRDVPQRKLAATRLLNLPAARILTVRAGPGNNFTPAILDSAGRTVNLREIRYRPFHAALARRSPDLVLDEALWLAERVFDNYSHWFTAHLPRLVMLRDAGLLENLVLPAERPSWLDESLAMIGIVGSDFRELPTPGVLHARNLRLVESDRFRPELLKAAHQALSGAPRPRDRRIFVSRRRAKGRMLVEEAELAPALEAAGFDLVAMEELSLAAQIELMGRTETLIAPHGAGLTNMLFCQPGTRICEIADPAYPNPNFYAMAAALGHRYHYIAARGIGDRHPLRQDLSVPVRDVQQFLGTLP